MKTKIVACLLALYCATTLAQTETKFVGGDISMLPEYEANSSGYLDENGSKIPDLLTWLTTECNWNTFRVRIFVNPTNANKDGVLQTTDYVKKLGKRIKDSGAYFMLDFHYSDTWVDATHIQAPAAWRGCTAAAMADSVSAYTARVLDELNAYGATPDLVQVGNEIMYGLCGIKVAPYDKADSNWEGFLGLLKAGCNAVREKCPQAKIIIHTDRPTNSGYNAYFYGKLDAAGVDYDVIGLSFYPFWHGYLTDAQVASKTDKNNLDKALKQLAKDFPTKEVQIVETAYNFQYWPTSGVNYNTQDAWPCSVTGQYNFVKDLVDVLKANDNVSGLSYWFPEEAGNGDYVTKWDGTDPRMVIKTWLNRGLWDENATSSGHKLNKLADKSNVPMVMGTYSTGIRAGVSNVQRDVVARKQLVDGRLQLVVDGTMYNVLGQKM